MRRTIALLTSVVLFGACGGGQSNAPHDVDSSVVDASAASCDGSCEQAIPPDALTAVVDLEPAVPHDLSIGTCTGSGHTLFGDTSRPANSTFVIGETITLTFTVSGACDIVSLHIVDENDNVVADAALPVDHGTATYAAPNSKLGYFRVNATLADKTAPVMLGTRPAGFLTYAIVPDPTKRTDYGDELSRFGMQGGFTVEQGDVIPMLGLRYVLATPAWAALEPDSAGQFATAVASGKAPSKSYVDSLTYKGKPWSTYEIALISSASIPGWAGPVAGTAGTQCKKMGALNAAGVSGLPGFATAMASWFSKTYPTQTKRYYQVTWEPATSWCWGGSGAQLTQYYQLVYDKLHAADPNAQVMGPTLFYEDATQLAGMYAAGFGKSIDAFSMHPYAAWPFEKTPFLADVRAQMAQASSEAGKTIPFIGTEHGLVSGEIGELNQALGNIRETIALLGEGFIHDYSFYVSDYWNTSPTETQNTYGFYWNLDGKIIYGTDKLGPKPAVPAFAALTYLLDGSTTQGPIAKLSGTQMGYRFTRGGPSPMTTLALWDYGAATSTISLPSSAQTVTVCDWMDNCKPVAVTDTITLTLGASPTYVIGQVL